MVGEYFSDYGEDRTQDVRSLVAALYSAVGGDEWALDISVDVRSLVFEDAEELRVLHERIARELPRRKVTVEEAANEALEAVKEIQVRWRGFGRSPKFWTRRKRCEMSTWRWPTYKLLS